MVSMDLIISGNFKLGLISKPKKKTMQINKILKDNANIMQMYKVSIIIITLFIYFSLLSTTFFLWVGSICLACECDLHKIIFKYLYPDVNIENPTKKSR